MKKNFKYYIIVWGVLLALFNLITFIVPGANKFTPSFWIGYGFITAALIGQLVCATKVFNQDENRKVFYNITLVKSSYAGLVVSFIAGAICMITPVPYWIAIIICAVILVLNILAVLKATVAIEAVSSIDEKIKTKTFFIKSLTADAESLMMRTSDDAIKAECRKVAEALRYSDPMSSDALSSVESQITIAFSNLSEAVSAGDKEKVVSHSKEVLILIDDRNRKCKLLK